MKNTKQHMNLLNEGPTELVLRVLSYLSAKDLIALSLVNKKMHDFTHCSFLKNGLLLKKEKIKILSRLKKETNLLKKHNSIYRNFFWEKKPNYISNNSLMRANITALLDTLDILCQFGQQSDVLQNTLTAHSILMLNLNKQASLKYNPEHKQSANLQKLKLIDMKDDLKSLYQLLKQCKFSPSLKAYLLDYIESIIKLAPMQTYMTTPRPRSYSQILCTPAALI